MHIWCSGVSKSLIWLGVCRLAGWLTGWLDPPYSWIMHGWMRSHILQLLGCICEFEMLHAYLMLWRLKITDLAGCVQAGWLAGWLGGSTIQLNHAWMDAIAYFAVTWMHMWIRDAACISDALGSQNHW
jgi:hypothetical protein